MDISAILSRIQEGVNQSSAATLEAMQGDMSNPEELIQVQFQLAMYGQAIQLSAGFTKKIDELITGIIAKI